MLQLPAGCGYKALKKEQQSQQNSNGNGDSQKDHYKLPAQ